MGWITDQKPCHSNLTGVGLSWAVTKAISKEEHVDAVINVKNSDPNINDLEVNVPVSNPFDILQIDPDSSTGASTADKK